MDALGRGSLAGAVRAAEEPPVHFDAVPDHRAGAVLARFADSHGPSLLPYLRRHSSDESLAARKDKDVRGRLAMFVEVIGGRVTDPEQVHAARPVV
jgi:hypothetical protein